MKALSFDLRQRIVDAYHAGEGTQAALADRFRVGKATVERLIRLHRDTGAVAPRPHAGGRAPRITDADRDDRPATFEREPDVRPSDLADRFATGTALWYRAGVPGVWLRWVVVRDPSGAVEPKGSLCTDTAVEPATLLGWYLRRWSVGDVPSPEVTFAEVRRHLGVETQRQWSDLAISRTTPCPAAVGGGLGLSSVVALVADQVHADGGLSARRGTRRRRRPSATLSRRCGWCCGERGVYPCRVQGLGGSKSRRPCSGSSRARWPTPHRAKVQLRSGYAASKHAMAGFFDSLRIELADSGVSVTTTFPGFVATGVRRHAVGPGGQPLGESPVREDEVMTADECARQILRATDARKREIVMTGRGKAGQWLKLIAPGLVDRVARRAIERGV